MISFLLIVALVLLITGALLVYRTSSDKFLVTMGLLFVLWSGVLIMGITVLTFNL